MITVEMPIQTNLNEVSQKLELAAQKVKELQEIFTELSEQGVQISLGDLDKG